MPREECTWPWNKQGTKREDPWKKTTYLRMRNMEDDGLVIFGPFADTQRAAIKKFVAIVRRVDREGKQPVVLLESRSFKNQAGGLTYVPDFKIVGWKDWEPDTPALPLTPIAVPITPPAKAPPPKLAAPARKRSDPDMDDEIPF